MSGDNYFGETRQNLAKLLVEMMILLANESKIPSGFQCCRWEQGSTAIRVECDSWKTIVEVLKKEKYRGYDTPEYPLPSKGRLHSEIFPVLKVLKHLEWADFNEGALKSRGTKSGGITFTLVHLPSQSVQRCINELTRVIKTYKPPKKEEPTPEPPPVSSVATTQIAGRPDLTPYFSNVPRSLARKFVGRTRILALLHKELTELPSNKFLSVVAMGGQGKTELCIQYGLRYKQFYPGGICWISAREGNIASQIVSFARTVGYSVDQGEYLTDEEKLDIAWNIWVEEPTLFIYDDVLAPLLEKSHLFPPPLKYFKVLFTTRDREPGVNVENFPLGELPLEDALELLGDFITPDRLKREPEFATDLMEFVEFLPLGIELVGGYLRSDLNLATSLEELSEFLDDKRAKWTVINTDVFNPTDPPLRTNQRNIGECFELSWVQLSSSDRKVANYIATLSQKRANSEFITQILTRTAELTQAPEYSPESQKQAFRRLIRYSLIKYIIENAIYHYSYHLLLRDFVWDKMPQEERDLWGSDLFS